MNKQCLLCQQNLTYHFDLKWFLTLQPLVDKYLCERCAANFIRLDNKLTCPGCGRLSEMGKLCSDCLRWQQVASELLTNKALYSYQTEAMKDYLERYKFLGDYRLRYVFQRQWCDFIVKNYPPKQGWLYVPIPVDQESKSQRGFNQVIGLAELLPLTEVLEMKQTHGRVKQSKKNRRQRMQTKQPFNYSGSEGEILQKKVVLLDDVYTTGRTLYHARAVLKKHGAALVRSVTLSR